MFLRCSFLSRNLQHMHRYKTLYPEVQQQLTQVLKSSRKKNMPNQSPPFLLHSTFSPISILFQFFLYLILLFDAANGARRVSKSKVVT